jgi:uncharacterized DUF497 family protein
MASAGFEWDSIKAARNQLKHGVSFDEAATAFEDPRSITIADFEHSRTEERCILIGRSIEGRVLVVVHTDRGNTIRLVSARRATWRERLTYEQA